MNIHVINGRFQPFHLGHLNYAKAAGRDCDVLVVGLTRVASLARAGGSTENEVAPHRFEEESNPLSFAERAVIVEAAISDCEGIACRTVFVPFPIERPELIPQFVPRDWKIVTTLHEDWNREKVRVLRDLGYQVSIVCEDEEKWIRGRDIRESMRSGTDDWRGLVPPAAAAAMDELAIPQRLVDA